MSIEQNTPVVNDELQANYDGYYVDGESKWREVGAKHKANNTCTNDSVMYCIKTCAFVAPTIFL